MEDAGLPLYRPERGDACDDEQRERADVDGLPHAR
jgi:hypothetical protein